MQKYLNESINRGYVIVKNRFNQSSLECRVPYPKTHIRKSVLEMYIVYTVKEVFFDMLTKKLKIK